MSVRFPNHSRSYDAAKSRVRFWGHDGAIEVSFFVDVSALRKLYPETRNTDDGMLTAFDAVKKHIHEVAARVYGRTKKESYACFLSAGDF